MTDDVRLTMDLGDQERSMTPSEVIPRAGKPFRRALKAPGKAGKMPVWARAVTLAGVLGAMLYGLGCGGGRSSSTPTTPLPAPTTPAPTPPVPVPVPEGLRVSEAGSGFLEFEWSPVEGATRYEIQLSLNADSFDVATSQIVTDGTKHRFEVSPETTGYARVRAGISDRWSDYSDSVSGASLPSAACGPAARNLLIDRIWPALSGGSQIPSTWVRNTAMSSWKHIGVDSDDCVTGLFLETGSGLISRASPHHFDGVLTGYLPPEIGRLNQLEELGLFGDFTGQIPSSLGSLSGLETLRLGGDFTGQIPSSLGSLSGLSSLYLSGDFTGQIPSSLGSLSGLETLTLVGDFTGQIPSSLGSLSGLSSLYLSGDFTGQIPSSLGSLSGLETLTLVGVTGPIPSWLGSLSGLSRLSLSGDFTGPIPSWLGSLSGLSHLSLSGDFTGPIPSWLGSLSSLSSLSLSGDFTGPIPSWLGSLSLWWLQLEGNQLTGQIPSALAGAVPDDRFFFWNFRENNLTGCIPRGIAEHLVENEVDPGVLVNPQKGNRNLPVCVGS